MASRLWLVGVAAAMVAGTVARIACLNAEFWLDEIWSLELARSAGSPFDVLFRTKHDNNHHLNTLALYFTPDGVWWGWYRLHSLIAGVLSIAVAARAARRWGKAEAVFAAWLMAGCSWFVLAFAEARGYSLAILFALVAFDALWRYLDASVTESIEGETIAHHPVTLSAGHPVSPSPPHPFTPSPRLELLVYWLATILGFLSHLTFVFATIGFVVWSMRRFARNSKTRGDELRPLLLCHGVPGLLLAVFGVVAILGVEKGGGPSVSRAAVVTSLISQGLGGPASGLLAFALTATAAAWFTWGVMKLHRQRSDLWVFFVACCVAAPALYLLVGPEYRFERYFFIPFAFFLVLAAHTLMSQRVRWLGVALLVGFLAGNALIVWRFTEAGRGQFHEALAWVLEQDESDTVRVGGDWDFRVRKYVQFYGDRIAPDRIRFVEAEGGITEWLLVHREDDSHPPEQDIDLAGVRYRQARSYPSRGPGAWGWFVYRRVQKADVPE